MKNLTKLNDKAVFGVYSLVGKNVLMLFMFKDKPMYCLRNGNTVVIPNKFKEEAGDIKELFDYLRSIYGVPKASLTEVRDFEDKASEREIMESFACPKGIVPATPRLAVPYLESEGFDCSALERSLPEPDPVLDYSELLKIPEAAQQFERIRDIVFEKKAVLAPELLPVAESIKHGKNRLVYLVGPAGTGKTMLTYLFSQYCGAPLITYQGSEGVEKDELIGCSDVNPDAKAGESPYRVVMGPLLRAYIEGWQVVIDEANYLLPSIMSCINSMVDDTPTYEFKGTVYQRHPNFVLYLTSNPGYEGTYVYNPATKSRGLTLLIDKLSPNEFAKRMVAYTDGKLSEDFFIQLNKLGDFVQNLSQQYGESSAVCLRHAQNFANLVLSRPCTIDEFTESFSVAYLSNALCMDKDNTSKVNDVLREAEFKNMMSTLFGLYDFATSPDVDPDASYSDYVGEEVMAFDDSGSGSDSAFDEKEFNDMFGVMED